LDSLHPLRMDVVLQKFEIVVVVHCCCSLSASQNRSYQQNHPLLDLLSVSPHHPSSSSIQQQAAQSHSSISPLIQHRPLSQPSTITNPFPQASHAQLPQLTPTSTAIETTTTKTTTSTGIKSYKRRPSVEPRSPILEHQFTVLPSRSAVLAEPQSIETLMSQQQALLERQQQQQQKQHTRKPSNLTILPSMNNSNAQQQQSQISEVRHPFSTDAASPIAAVNRASDRLITIENKAAIESKAMAAAAAAVAANPSASASLQFRANLKNILIPLSKTSSAVNSPVVEHQFVQDMLALTPYRDELHTSPLQHQYQQQQQQAQQHTTTKRNSPYLKIRSLDSRSNSIHEQTDSALQHADDSSDQHTLPVRSRRNSVTMAPLTTSPNLPPRLLQQQQQRMAQQGNNSTHLSESHSHIKQSREAKSDIVSSPLVAASVNSHNTQYQKQAMARTLREDAVQPFTAHDPQSDDSHHSNDKSPRKDGLQSLTKSKRSKKHKHKHHAAATATVSQAS
jgi:hypothetical protein